MSSLEDLEEQKKRLVDTHRRRTEALASIAEIRKKIAGEADRSVDGDGWEDQVCVQLDGAIEFLEFGRILNQGERRMLQSVEQQVGPEAAAKIRESMRR